MKYLVIIPDGAAGEPLSDKDNKTSLELANMPVTQSLASKGDVGLVKTIPEGMPSGSDVANLAILGFDPKKYLKGRSSLEAESMGLDLDETDFTYRVNFVTLNTNGSDRYEDFIMEDHSAYDIKTEEAKVLIGLLSQSLATDDIKFYSGVSYRNLLVTKTKKPDLNLTPPHDIIGKAIGNYIPEGFEKDLMVKSFEILKNDKNKTKANSIWIWGKGSKTVLPEFSKLYGVKGSIISAVDLVKGIGRASNLKVVEVEGATGTPDTDYFAKGRAAIAEFKNGSDFVYIHIEAPDEASHAGDADLKIKSLENIDAKIVGPLITFLEDTKEPYRVLIVPDHRTPVKARTHSKDPVPYIIFDSENIKRNSENLWTEESAKSGKGFMSGEELLRFFMEK